MIRRALLIGAALGALLTAPAFGASSVSSSGGYSRPSSPSPAPSRPAPSFSAPSSGGYSRSSSAAVAPAVPRTSAGDRAVTSAASGDALRAYRAPADSGAESRPRPFLPSSASVAPAGIATAPAQPTGPTHTTVVVEHHSWWPWYHDPAPIYVPVQVAPAFQAPITAGSPVVDFTPTSTVAPEPPRHSGHPWLWSLFGIAVLGGGAYAGYRYMLVRQHKPGSAAAFALSYAAVKTEADPPKQERFRPGMVVDIDQTPFLLAKEVMRVSPPATGLATVASVSRIRIGREPFLWLHLSDTAFVQIHEGDDGEINDARYFALIDTVIPADAPEWSFWLDKDDGAIGMGVFTDRAGIPYARLWAPSNDASNRVEPREIAGDLRGVAMLYGRKTDLPEPAPQTDLLLIETDEARRNASVRLYAGIDLDPASLTLT